MRTVLRGVGEVVRNGNRRRMLAAIHFDVDGASIVTSQEWTGTRSSWPHDHSGKGSTEREHALL